MRCIDVNSPEVKLFAAFIGKPPRLAVQEYPYVEDRWQQVVDRARELFAGGATPTPAPPPASVGPVRSLVSFIKDHEGNDVAVASDYSLWRYFIRDGQGFWLLHGVLSELPQGEIVYG